MKKLTKEEKKLLMRKWKTSQKKEYLLSKDEVEKIVYLFRITVRTDTMSTYTHAYKAMVEKQSATR